MGDWGHTSQKRTLLVGTVSWLREFGSFASDVHDGTVGASSSSSTQPAIAVKSKDAKSKGEPLSAKGKGAPPLVKRQRLGGRTKVWGTEALKGSQVYPVKFALRICQLSWPTRFQLQGASHAGGNISFLHRTFSRVRGGGFSVGPTAAIKSPELEVVLV